MTREPMPDSKSAAAARRDQRLKAALKANMGRRKAQARERSVESHASEINAQDLNEIDDKPGDATEADIDKE